MCVYLCVYVRVLYKIEFVWHDAVHAYLLEGTSPCLEPEYVCMCVRLYECVYVCV
jgi:hypothetical protein